MRSPPTARPTRAASRWPPTPPTTSVATTSAASPAAPTSSTFDATGDDLVDDQRSLTLESDELRDGFDAQLAETPLALVTAPTLKLYGDPTAPGSSSIGLTWATWNLHPAQRTTTWLRDGVEVPGDGTTYFLGAADRGHTISVREDVVSTFGQRASVDTAGMRIAAAPAPSPTPTPTPSPTPVPVTTPTPTPTPTSTAVLAPEVAPRLRGELHPGGVVRVTRGDWPVEGLSWGYRWYADGDRIRGEHRRRLELRPRLVGARLSVRVVVRAEDLAPWRGRLRFPPSG